MKRSPEIGAMDITEEVESYDLLSKKYLGMVEKFFVRRLRKLLAYRKLEKEAVILDVGTGTANIPIRFVSQIPSANFVAMDLSLKMLRKARLNTDDQGLADRIFFVCADAEQLPFKEETFDLVFSHSSIHHLASPIQAISEIIRVTRNGCRFIIRDLRRPPWCLLELYVQIFGFCYDNLMKKMYRESLRAGFTYKEMKDLSREIEQAAVNARRFFIIHVSLEGTRINSVLK